MNFFDASTKFMHLIPGCPEQEAAEALRYAVIELCSRSGIQTNWVQTDVDHLTFSTDTDIPAAVQLVELFDCFIGGIRVDLVHLSDADALSNSANGNTVLVFGDDLNNTMTAFRRPNPGTPVKMLVSLAPTPDAEEFSDSIWRRYREPLKQGALARLLADPGTPYVNEPRAAVYAAQFEAAIRDASIQMRALRRSQGKRLRVVPVGEDGNSQVMMDTVPLTEMHQIYWDASAFWTPTTYWM